MTSMNFSAQHADLADTLQHDMRVGVYQTPPVFLQPDSPILARVRIEDTPVIAFESDAFDVLIEKTRGRPSLRGLPERVWAVIPQDDESNVWQHMATDNKGITYVNSFVCGGGVGWCVLPAIVRLRQAKAKKKNIQFSFSIPDGHPDNPMLLEVLQQLGPLFCAQAAVVAHLHKRPRVVKSYFGFTDQPALPPIELITRAGLALG